MHVFTACFLTMARVWPVVLNSWCFDYPTSTCEIKYMLYLFCCFCQIFIYHWKKNERQGPLWRRLATSSSLFFWPYSLSKVALITEARTQLYRASQCEICKMMPCLPSPQSWDYLICILIFLMMSWNKSRLDWIYNVFTKRCKGVLVPETPRFTKKWGQDNRS